MESGVTEDLWGEGGGEIQVHAQGSRRQAGIRQTQGYTHAHSHTQTPARSHAGGRTMQRIQTEREHRLV
eukprot:35078-Eustigmatos_ZCMA.PRE.1